MTVDTLAPMAPPGLSACIASVSPSDDEQFPCHGAPSGKGPFGRLGGRTGSRRPTPAVHQIRARANP
ncbi:hypothetical protein G6F68_021174 [Rhizopus microsporus]|nr:hypothetical protein G6F68_021174 [Rhizopus microsporus]